MRAMVPRINEAIAQGLIILRGPFGK